MVKITAKEKQAKRTIDNFLKQSEILASAMEIVNFSDLNELEMEKCTIALYNLTQELCNTNAFFRRVICRYENEKKSLLQRNYDEKRQIKEEIERKEIRAKILGGGKRGVIK